MTKSRFSLLLPEWLVLYDLAIDMEKRLYHDPNVVMIKQRQYIEYLLREVVSFEDSDFDERASLNLLLSFVQDKGLLPTEIGQALEDIRIWGNRAVHSGFSRIETAKDNLDKVYLITCWFLARYSDAHVLSQKIKKVAPNIRPRVNFYRKYRSFFSNRQKDNLAETQYGTNLKDFSFQVSQANKKSNYNGQYNKFYERDVFETPEEYKCRIEKEPVPIGLIGIFEEEDNSRGNLLPVSVSFDRSLPIIVPEISGLYIEKSTTSVATGRFTLFGKIIIFQGRPYLDINSLFCGIDDEPRIKVHCLVLSRMEYESWEQFEYRIKPFESLFIGYGFLIRDAYDLDTQRFPMELDLKVAFSHLFQKSNQYFITLPREKAKALDESNYKHEVFGDFKIVGNQLTVNRIWLATGDGDIAIAVSERISSAKVKQHERWGYINKQGVAIVKCIYADIDDFYDGMARIRRKGKWGYINREGKEVITPCYENAWNFREGRAFVAVEDKWGVIDQEGKLIVDFHYDDSSLFIEGHASVSRNGHFGFLDRSGMEVVPVCYENVSPYSEGLAAVKKAGFWVYIDQFGNVVLTGNYDYAWSFKDGHACVRKKEKWGLINKKGLMTIPFSFDGIIYLKGGLYAVKYNEKWGLVNNIGVNLTGYDYDYCYELKAGMLCVQKDNKYGLINKNGEEIVPCHFDYIRTFDDGIAALCSNNKWGFVDSEGKNFIGFIYDDAAGFTEGLAPVKLNGKWGFIDKSGHKAIDFYYDNARSFKEGLAAVELNRRWGYINRNGHEIIPCVYEKADSFR